MPLKVMDMEEQSKVIVALSEWFKSQDIATEDATAILAHMLGSMISFHSKGNKDRLDEGIILFQMAVEACARMYDERR